MVSGGRDLRSSDPALCRAAAQLPPDARPYLWLIVLLCGSLALFRWLALGIEALRGWQASRRPKKTFHLTSRSGMWFSTKQADGSTIVQIMAELLIRNQHSGPIGIAQVRIIRPRRLRGEVVHANIIVHSPDFDMHGSALGETIPSGMSLPAQAVVMVRHRPPAAQGKELQVLFALADDEGNEQRVWVNCKGQAARRERDQPAPSEPIHAIEDQIAKDVAAILQAEAARYDKNGRGSGGFGSLYVAAASRPINGFGQDSSYVELDPGVKLATLNRSSQKSASVRQPRRHAEAVREVPPKAMSNPACWPLCEAA